MKSSKIKKLVSFFFEVGTLRKVIRSHRQTLLVNDLTDNIASHSFRTAIIGYFLAKEVGVDPDKVIKMCLLHDIEESRCGDQNWVHKKYIKVFEEEIRRGQLKNLPNQKELLALSGEYQERKTKEAKVAKDADLLEEIFLLREYEWQGNKEAIDWLKGTKKSSQQEKLMFTRLAKEIAKETKKQKPSLWWNNLWTNKRR
jgi:putative hydrolase of HD superfamily